MFKYYGIKIKIREISRNFTACQQNDVSDGILILYFWLFPKIGIKCKDGFMMDDEVIKFLK